VPCSRISESLVGPLVGSPIINDQVTPLGETELLQFSDKDRISRTTCDRIVRAGGEHADARGLVRLLRSCRERPRCRCAEQRDELPPLQLRDHSITSSARC
jgi:hypothetical protein